MITNPCPETPHASLCLHRYAINGHDKEMDDTHHPTLPLINLVRENENTQTNHVTLFGNSRHGPPPVIGNDCPRGTRISLFGHALETRVIDRLQAEGKSRRIPKFDYSDELLPWCTERPSFSSLLVWKPSDYRWGTKNMASG